jgi:hypothetical protein
VKSVRRPLESNLMGVPHYSYRYTTPSSMVLGGVDGSSGEERE